MSNFVHPYLKLQSQLKKSFSQRRFLLIMIGLIVISIIDVSLVKINDLIDKYFIPMQSKLILFTINSSHVCFYNSIWLDIFMIHFKRPTKQDFKSQVHIRCLPAFTSCISGSGRIYHISTILQRVLLHVSCYWYNCIKLWDGGGFCNMALFTISLLV